MDITSYIKPNTIAVNVSVTDKNDLINKLIDLADKSGNINDINQVREEVFKREQLMSTGIGDGIAIPHAKTDAVKDTVCSIAILKEAVDFESVDKMPVDIAFLLIGREQNVGAHLRLLSKISRFLCDKEKLSQIKKCTTADEVVSLFHSGMEV